MEKMEFVSEKMRKVISECLIGKKNEEMISFFSKIKITGYDLGKKLINAEVTK